jgi:flagellar export protein FliJ
VRQFRFSLESALRWRRQQVEIEEQSLQALRAELGRAAAERQALLGLWKEEQARLQRGPECSGLQFQLLGWYSGYVQAHERRLVQHMRDTEARIERQQERYAAARRRVELLERVRDRRLAEYRRAAAAEEDALASELFLSRWQARG